MENNKKKRIIYLFVNILMLIFLFTSCAVHRNKPQIGRLDDKEIEEIKDVRTERRKGLEIKAPPFDKEVQMEVKKTDQGIESYIIGPEDRLFISILRHEDMNVETEVQANGMITMPFIGDVEAAGLTTHQLQKIIITRLSRYIRDPFVTVLVKEFNSSKIFILGEVKLPGVYPLKRRTHLLEGLTTAGGITEKGDLSSAYIVRRNTILPIDFEGLILDAELTQNISLEKDDFIYIPDVTEKRIFVLGEVNNPGVIPWRHNLNIVDAISSSGGFRINKGAFGIEFKTAVEDQVKVIRGSLKDPEIIEINVADIMKGLIDNVVLKGGDIVYVPETRFSKYNEFIAKILPTLNTLNMTTNLARPPFYWGAGEY
ncbi:MAG: polysaccharide export protein [Nitrospinae bacterium]|nr:polysaccharide export protein [Nitrospinota bacterium]